MGKDKPPSGSLYPRESYVCFFLFVVELASVWSLVALIYNTFLVYIPTSNELEEGFLPEPAMCTTTRNVLSNECTWWSCMEWCLSATEPPDECIHIFATVRNPGTDVRLSQCSPAEIRQCDVLDLSDPFAPDIIFNCKEDFVCKHLTGIFKCEDAYQPYLEEYQKKKGGTCKNITLMYECVPERMGNVYNCGHRKADCLELEGLFNCYDGRCVEILGYHCERRCKNIACDKNIIIQSGDDIFLGDCQVVEDENNGQLIWMNDQVNTLLANCISVSLDLDDLENRTYVAKDCVNGTLMPRDLMPKNVNYTKLLELFGSEEGYMYRLDQDKENATMIPFETHITIYNETKVKMNHEGCSNELSEKCSVFHREYGKDGRNYTSPSRFPCYYSLKQSEFVAATLNLQWSRTVFLLALIIPLTIFLFSCFFCLFCSYCIIVDEQGHMHLRGCYHYFRRPYTEYEKWEIQHNKKRVKREKAEAKRIAKEEEKLRQMREEMERKREEMRKKEEVVLEKSGNNSFTDFSIQVHSPQDI